MMNRYQRRKYGSTLPTRRPSQRRWLIYAVALLIIVGVVYFRVLSKF